MYLVGYVTPTASAASRAGRGTSELFENFPERFEELCQVQDDIGEGAYLHRNRHTDQRFSLRHLPVGKAVRNEAIPACSFFCELAEQEYGA